MPIAIIVERGSRVARVNADPKARMLRKFLAAFPWWDVRRDSFAVNVNYLTKHVDIDITAPASTPDQFKAVGDWLQELVFTGKAN